MLKVLAFDFDGTLCESGRMCIEVTKRSMEPFLGHPVDDAEATKYFGLTEEGMLRLAVPGHAEEAIRLYYDLFEKSCKTTALFEGAEALVDYVRSLGLKSALITGKGKHTCSYVLDYFHLTSHFDYIQSGADVVGGKYISFLTFMKEHQLSPDEMIYLGDATSDVSYCRQAGIRCLSASWAATCDEKALENANPGNVCRSMEEAEKKIVSLV